MKQLAAICAVVTVLFITGIAQAGAVTVTIDGAVGENVLFNNTSNLDGWESYNDGGTLTDDIHMSSAGTMTAFDFIYYVGYPGNTLTATVKFFSNDATDSTSPTQDSVALASYTLANLPSDGFGGNSSGEHLVRVEVDAIELPKDVWMSIVFPIESNPDSPQFSWTNGLSVPSVGASDDLWALADGSLQTGNGFTPLNLAVTIETVPEPATICLLGLGGLMLRKRKV